MVLELRNGLLEESRKRHTDGTVAIIGQSKFITSSWSSKLKHKLTIKSSYGMGVNKKMVAFFFFVEDFCIFEGRI